MQSNEAVEHDEKPEGDKSKDGKAEIVRYWIECIDAQKKECKEWRDDADNALRVYRGDREGEYARHVTFNIFHSNIETTLPAIYNSTPVPDVRRKYGDKDPVAKTVSQIIERNISYSCDNYDFDEVMRQVLFDGLVPGRGVARVRYLPYFEPAQPEAEPEREGDERQLVEEKPGPGEALAYEEVAVEYVPWKRVILGPADCWEMVPWVAFEHYLTRAEIRELIGEEKGGIADDVALDVTISGNEESDDAQKGDTFRRARVYEIWDKSERKVIFVATGYKDAALLDQDDPLGLESFWPIPRPVQPVATPGNMTPVCPYSIYRDLVEELNQVTFRISKLLKQLRVRGGFATGADDLKQLSTADDGELVPLTNLEAWLDGGIEKAITWWPIEPITKAVAELYIQREQIKQTIYEVTGISDIVRGASKASETATAQQIKSQWGSLRIQRLQSEVQRVARDLFRLKAEVISKRFSPETMMMVSGIRLMPAEQKQMLQQQLQMAQQSGQPPQVPPEIQKAMNEPSLEEVMHVIKSDKVRTYRIDIESDSTIRADLTRKQQDMTLFLQGTAQYIAAVGPAVQSGQMPEAAAVEVYASFARNFKLGKQAEDALESMADAAAKPKPPKPDPEMEKMKAQLGIEQQKMQMQQQADQAKLALEQQKAQMDAQNAQAKLQAEMAMAEQKMQFEFEMERQKAGQQYQIELMKANADIEIKRQQAQEQAQLNQAATAQKIENDRVLSDAKAKQASKAKASAQ